MALRVFWIGKLNAAFWQQLWKYSNTPSGRSPVCSSVCDTVNKIESVNWHPNGFYDPIKYDSFRELGIWAGNAKASGQAWATYRENFV